jgi:hypothetical protein
MRLFRRTETHGGAGADEYLTYFTREQAHDFRRLVSDSFALVGRDVSVFTDHVEDRTGTTFGLWNIGALCAGHDARDWPVLIDDHIRRVTTPTQHLDELSAEEFVSGLYLRIVDETTLPNVEELALKRELAPRLIEVVSVDLPDSVATPPADELLAHGPLDELVERGRRNLLALLASGEIQSEIVGARRGGRYVTVTGEPYFTASLALVLSEAIEHFSGETDVGRGVLVAVPFRHQLLYRVADGPDADRAIDEMFRVARLAYHDEPGPISPHVYWVRNHRWVQVTSVEGGKPKVHRTADLVQALAPAGDEPSF